MVQQLLDNLQAYALLVRMVAKGLSQRVRSHLAFNADFMSCIVYNLVGLLPADRAGAAASIRLTTGK